MATLSDMASEIRDAIESRHADTGQRRFFLSNFRELGTQTEVATALGELSDAHWLDCRAKLVCPEGHRFNVIACADVSRTISETYCDECDAVFAFADIEAIPSYTMTEPWMRSIPEKKKSSAGDRITEHAADAYDRLPAQQFIELYVSGDLVSEKNSIDNSNIAGSVVGSGSQKVGRDLNASVQPAAASETLDHESFKADVDEALKALTDDIDSLEEHYDALHAALVRIRKQSADAETVGDVQEMVEEIWVEKTAESFETNLEKYGSKDFAKALLGSPVLAGLVG